jgi:peroxidase
MAKTDQYNKLAFVAVLLYASLAAGVNGHLKVGFYHYSCPQAESTVFEVVKDAFLNDTAVAPGLVRMHFHDCFVRVGMNIPSLLFYKSMFLSRSMCLC